MNKNFGVIIQGPLISFGSGGRNDNPEGFNSTNTIKQNIKIISKKIPLENIVFSGWNTDYELESLNIAKIFSEDPFKFDYLNQKRQFYTIRKGFEYLSRNSEIKYFIKIRTDQLFPNEFWEWVITLNKKLDKQILISELYNNSPFTIGDFVISSSKKNFDNFINSQFLKRYSINGARNMVFKYLIFTSQNIEIKFNRNYVLNDLKLIFKFDLIYKAWSNFLNVSFFSIPLDIYENIVWRGISMDERFDKLQQIFTYNETYTEKHTIKLFKSEYGRYFSFFKIYLKKRLLKLLGKNS